MTTNTAAMLAEFRELNAKRTPGPWFETATPKDKDGWPTCAIVAATAPNVGNKIYATAERGTFPGNDNRFIAFCGTHAQALIESQAAEIERLKAERDANLASVPRDMQVRVENADASLAATIAYMRGQIQRQCTCDFCSAAFNFPAALREHSATCTEHPAVKRCKVAEDWITVLEHSLVDYRDETEKLRAELAETPPTLGWLVQQFGEPTLPGVSVSHWGSGLSWWHHHERAQMRVTKPITDYDPLRTRAAVLAAVAKQETGQ